MKKIINSLLVICLVTFLFYGCSESDPVSSQNNNTNGPPNQPSNPSPSDGDTGTSRLVTLAWTCTDPNPEDTLRYDIFLDDKFPPNIFLADVTTNSLTVGLVAAQTTFYWKIQAKDNHSGVTVGPNWSFTTGN